MSVHTLLTSPLSRGLFQKAIIESGGGRDGVLTGRAMRENRSEPSAEAIGVNFARRYGLNIVGHIEPKPGIPPTPSHTLEIINLIMTDKIPIILVEPYFDLKTPKFIGDKTGVPVVSFYPSVGGLPEIKDYFALFDHDIDAFDGAMKGKP